MCRSAAVRGRGCLKGPGPVPTPVLSPGSPVAVTLAIIGDVEDARTDGGLTALWFEGRMLNCGEESGRAGGAICWEVRLEVVLETRGDDATMGLGDAGTEFRSGAIVVDKMKHS